MFSDTRVYFILCILSLCSAYFSEANIVRWVQNFEENITRYRRQANCRISEFECKSGQCISEETQCNGIDNCDDGSDETIENCSNIPCSPSLFRCDYGACISKILECDGVKDCKDNSDETSSKCKKNVKPVTFTQNTPGCGRGKFQCRSGQCIEEKQLCDGKADCNDNSDEAAEECSSSYCSVPLYRCKYGACVAKNAQCNGVQECFDGSDEASCNATSPTRTGALPIVPVTPARNSTVTPADGSCLVPDNPPNGEFKVGAATSNPGDYAPPFSALVINCKNRYKPSPPQGGKFPICIMGRWSTPPPTCARACPSINPTIVTKVSCRFDNIPIDSCENPVEGTIASLSCESFYEEPGLSRYPYRICKDGSWDYPISECLPVCGVKRPRGRVNVINGVNATKGDYPWQIGIYNPTKSLICGGSILDRRVIITAAHCFTPGDILINIENYTVAAGKYYMKYDDDRDEHAQYSKIDEIHIPQRYKGITHFYEADLAVLILKTKLNISQAVQPVCVDWGNKFEYQQLAENREGIVTGWGYTTMNREQSEELKELNVPYISYNKCFHEVPKSFRKYLTSDKMCGGYLEKGTAICGGDSGGGLAFLHSDDRYYIRGIVSTSPASESICDSNQYATYTLVSEHRNFVEDLVTRNRS